MLYFNRYDYRGFLPRIYADKLNPTTANEEYYRTYVERDVRQLVQVENPVESSSTLHVRPVFSLRKERSVE